MRNEGIYYITILSLAAIVLGAACLRLVFLKSGSAEDAGGPDSAEHAYLLTDNRCVQLAVAQTTAEKRRGLSKYATLQRDEGMLFPYAKEGRYGFWMRNMNFPIDIIWLNKNDTVVTIARRVSPDSYPKTFYPTKPAKNVIEVASGAARRLHIKSGDQLKLFGPTTTRPEGC